MQAKSMDKPGLDGSFTWSAKPGQQVERAFTEALAAGDREAFTVFIDTHKDALVGYLFRMCGEAGLAEDLAQESFLRFFKASERLWRKAYQPKAYLFRIGVNLVRSHERKQFRFLKIKGLFQQTLLAGPDGDEVVSSESASQVRDALLQLPLRFREPLVLHVLEGWRYEEIARCLGVGVGTVKSRIYRAKLRMKKTLQTYFKERL